MRTHDDCRRPCLHGNGVDSPPRRTPSRAVGTTALVFWGAALMWSVDCVHAAMEGEGLLDLSREDAVLGAIILAAGLGLHAILAFRENLRAARA